MKREMDCNLEYWNFSEIACHVVMFGLGLGSQSAASERKKFGVI